MDVSAMKEKLSALTTKKEKKEKIDYAKYLWKPKGAGEHKIRIVPSELNKQDPFQEVFLHYGLKQFPIWSLQNWGEQDPIVNFAKELRKSGEKDDYFLSKKLEPKQRWFVPVVVRGEEDKGVRLWEFGKGVLKNFLGVDEDFGDYTDVAAGHDFTVTMGTGEVGTNKNATVVASLAIKPKPTPLSPDAATVEAWLKDQPKILDIQRKPTYDELKKVLEDWLNASDEDGEGSIETVNTTTEVKAETASEPLGDLPWDAKEESPAPAKKKKTKFDNLF